MIRHQAGEEARATQLLTEAEANYARAIGARIETPDMPAEEILRELQVDQIELEIITEVLDLSRIESGSIQVSIV
jgi:hypothetical protein